MGNISRYKTVFIVPRNVLQKNLSLAAVGLATHIYGAARDEVDTDEIAAMYPGVDLEPLLTELDNAGLFNNEPDIASSNLPEEKPKKPARKSIYIMECAGRIKIGVAANVRSRRSALQSGNPGPVTLVWSSLVGDAFLIEMQAHAILSVHRIGGEWFDCSREAAIGAVRSAIERSAA